MRKRMAGEQQPKAEAGAEAKAETQAGAVG